MPPRRRTEDGATLVEYAVLIAYIALLCLAAAAFVGDWVRDEFKAVADLL